MWARVALVLICFLQNVRTYFLSWLSIVLGSNFRLILVTTTLAILTSIYLYARWFYRYWERLGIPKLGPSFPFGVMNYMFTSTRDLATLNKTLYEQLKKEGNRFGGIFVFYQPTLVLTDLEVIKNVLTKDFHHFTDHGTPVSLKHDPLNRNLFNLEGKAWKDMRVKMTPAFTSGRMKMMFKILVGCTDNLKNKIEELADGNTPIDIKDEFCCFTIDTIGSCVYGIDCQSFGKERSEIHHYGRKFFDLPARKLFQAIIMFTFPPLGDALGLSVTDKTVTEFFMRLVKETVEYREKNNVVRKDFLQLFLDLRQQEGWENFSLEDITSQSFLFFGAGFETSSTVMAFTLYEIARNKDVQDKLRKEIEEVLEAHDGNITYEAVKEMKYLDQVVKESLRMYPPIPMLQRKCTQDYTLPDTDITIKKGLSIMIPIMGLHYDPEFFPDPHKFNPDRFQEDAKQKPFTYLPFGEGPRNCIGKPKSI